VSTGGDSGRSNRAVDNGSGDHHYQPNNIASSNDGNKNKSGDCHSGNFQTDPIAVDTGTKLETYPIFALPGEMGLSFTLYYNTALKVPQTQSNPYWSTNLQYSLIDATCHVDKRGNLICSSVLYLRPDGSQIRFSGTPQGGPYTEVGGGGLATLSYNSGSATYTLHDEDGTTKVFGSGGSLRSMTDASGISWNISVSYSSGGTTYTVTHTSGKSYSVTYGAAVNNVAPVTVTDPAGNVYTLQMTGAIMAPDFLSITYPGTPSTKVSFKYSSVLPDLLTEVDYNDNPYVYTSYDTAPSSAYLGWATGTHLADNSENVAIQYGQDGTGNLRATVTNALGHRHIQTYAGTNGSGGANNGQLSEVSDDAVSTCGATSRSRTYDVNGNLSQTVDNNNNVHTYTYAVTGQLQSETEARGTSVARTTDYVWDPDLQRNRLLGIKVEGWSEIAYAYNAQNRLASTKVTNLSATGTANQTLTTTYGYALYANGMVHVMTISHPSPDNSDTDTYTYDTLGNLASFADGLGHTTVYTNYNGLGEVGRVAGPNGNVTDYTYDARGRLRTKMTYPNGVAATWTYGYDAFGLLASETTPAGATTTWNRNAVMRVTSIVRNDKDGTSTEGFGYDANGDITTHTVSRNGTTSASETLRYDALGRLYQRQGMHGQLLTYGYDGNGNVLTVTDAAGHTVSSQYDALNRLTRTISSGGASPLAFSTTPALGNSSYAVNWGGASSDTLQAQVGGGTSH
jgi:YD repeat-containing protein